MWWYKISLKEWEIFLLTWDGGSMEQKNTGSGIFAAMLNLCSASSSVIFAFLLSSRLAKLAADELDVNKSPVTVD